MYIECEDNGVTVYSDDLDTCRDFIEFVCELYNESDLDSLYLSDLQYCGNDFAGYYIITNHHCEFKTIWVDPYEYNEFTNEGSVYLPYQKDVYTDEEVEEIIDSFYN